MGSAVSLLSRRIVLVDQSDELERAAQRSGWPVRRYSLGQEPPEDLSARTSATERIAMMWPLALEAWKLAGLPIPDYSRENLPSRIVRGSKG